jgi:hypothetical protein
MKRLVLLSVLTGMCFMVAIAQPGNQKKTLFSDRNNGFIGANSLAGKHFAEVIKPDEKLHINPQRLTAAHPELLPGFSSRAVPDDHMPVLKPKGYYHGIVIKPDSTFDYKLIIKKP